LGRAGEVNPVNMVTPIRADESIHGTVAERAHAHLIRMHCPTGDEMELAARCDLATLRDAALVGSRKAGDAASVMLGEVCRLASHAVYAAIPTSRLIRIKAALTLTMMAAREIERVERDG
jgi:hypothetical protein